MCLGIQAGLAECRGRGRGPRASEREDVGQEIVHGPDAGDPAIAIGLNQPIGARLVFDVEGLPVHRSAVLLLGFEVGPSAVGLGLETVEVMEEGELVGGVGLSGGDETLLLAGVEVGGAQEGEFDLDDPVGGAAGGFGAGEGEVCLSGVVVGLYVLAARVQEAAEGVGDRLWEEATLDEGGEIGLCPVEVLDDILEEGAIVD